MLQNFATPQLTDLEGDSIVVLAGADLLGHTAVGAIGADHQVHLNLCVLAHLSRAEKHYFNLALQPCQHVIASAMICSISHPRLCESGVGRCSVQ